MKSLVKCHWKIQGWFLRIFLEGFLSKAQQVILTLSYHNNMFNCLQGWNRDWTWYPSQPQMWNFPLYLCTSWAHSAGLPKCPWWQLCPCFVAICKPDKGVFPLLFEVVIGDRSRIDSCRVYTPRSCGTECEILGEKRFAGMSGKGL